MLRDSTQTETTADGRDTIDLLAELEATRARVKELEAQLAERTRDPQPADDRQEMYFRRLSAQSNAIMLLIDREAFTIVEGNPAACRFYGLEPSELSGKRLAELCLASSEELRELYSQPTPDTQYRLYLRQRVAGGDTRQVEFFAGPLQGEGDPYLLGVVFDVSARLDAERALRISEIRLRLALESSSIVIYEWHIADRRVQYDAGLPRLFGYRLPDVSASPYQMRRYFHPDDFRLYWKALSAHLRGASGPFEKEFRIRRYDGGWAWALQRGRVIARDENGRPMVMSGTITDITRRKSAEEALFQSQQMLRLVFDTVPQRIYWKDRDLYYLGCNRTCAEAAGLSDPEDIVGRTDYELAWSDMADQYRADDLAIIRSGWPRIGFEHPVHRSDSSFSWERSSKIPLHDKDGEIIGLLCVNEDITEAKVAEERLREAKQHAESADRAKSEFLALMSHEIRTPLNAVIGCSSMLLEISTDERQRELLKIIDAGGEALLSLINDILDLSKIESGRIELEEVNFDLRDAIRETVELFSIKAQQKHLELSTFIAPEVPRQLIADRARLNQIITNLVSNAIKFTPQGSVSIGLNAEPMADPAEGEQWARLAQLRREHGPGVRYQRIRLTVRDSGIGMTEQQQARLFQPFTQANRSIASKFGGTGLGLVICKRLAELMQGEVEIQSAPGEGSIFTVSLQLPAMLSEAVQPDELPVSFPEGCTFAEAYPMSILVAEDVPQNQVVISTMLRSLGYIPVCVSDGSEVLSVLSLRSYDLIMMDLRMPEVDGLQATRAIRNRKVKAISYEAPIEIIALTAHAVEGDRQQCLAAGMSDYLSKPIRLGNLQVGLAKAWARMQTDLRSSQANSPDISPSTDPVEES